MNARYGMSLRKMRMERKMSQTDITNNQISRSLIAKIENDDVTPSIDKFRVMLQQLNISFEEFFYINDHYHLSDFEKFKKKFFSMASNSDQEVLHDLLKECDDMLAVHRNTSLIEIKAIIMAMMKVSNNEYQKASKLVEPIWKRISKIEVWSLFDIHLISYILFLFPVSVAIDIVNKAIKSLRKYDDYLENNMQEMKLKINLTLIMIKSNKVSSKTLAYLDEVLTESKKEYNSLYYIVALSRKGICRVMTGDEKGIEDIEKALLLCQMMDDVNLYNGLLKEKEVYLGGK
ncbi:Rgg/GadR/MutR family transcriptional regulator [Isobaculum melis]|uniref:Transcriptional activator, Rgg/GadR/MutR family, C-terminal domain-containing protein n=1 Tax=Isobaculum melis TaxID=142588 RepID=A0A1H9TNN9_9LACT|nr:Rgg/GadR/MutR family transcriptional regulator [Isobaculum melis]SER98742.1 transcriptional activator, Rgg/GadR/MutR family, C-terminal domain-containing protein [Isobaculum melis]